MLIGVLAVGYIVGANVCATLLSIRQGDPAEVVIACMFLGFIMLPVTIFMSLVVG